MRYRDTVFGACSAGAILAWSLSCAPPDVEGIRQTAPYFSLENYFRQEAERLDRQAPQIHKTVSKNGEAESRDIRIDDWQKELALFSDADINKPAWQGSYQRDSTHSTLTYTRIDPALRTERIIVEKHTDGTVKHIHVTNRVDNMLYNTLEELDYYPDSLYRISKQQQVRIIGKTDYTVIGQMP
ncbi:hypothetical protein [Parapedobacter sp. DT-150]|uniref:hypothetical protein n=1 Tax=Parapedobacter sp. DT-150 TaxID=3396162 RepID=UPI003F1DCB2B